jgi:hypothetical protein
VIRVRTSKQATRKLFVESVAQGLGYAAALIWIGSAMVGSFSYQKAYYPYWSAFPHLRTDTAGFMAFAVALVSLVFSRYLQLSRGATAPVELATRPAGLLAVQAVADVTILLGTGLVIYLSLNAVTHPWTLQRQLTHLLPWPSEGTVRVIALGVCLVAVATRRYLQAAGAARSPRNDRERPTAGCSGGERPTGVTGLETR